MKAILSLSLIVGSLCCQAQTNVYSIAIYAGGTSYREICSMMLPFPPYHYKLTERSRYEDARGLVIIDVGREKKRGGVLHRYLDVEIGSESFTVPLDLPPPKHARMLPHALQREAVKVAVICRLILN
ncbi:MAG: hypothetical protein M9920_05830 [Verrucomicrobiae bacterium]|nr:hypothetical protein [Verrucomicrobiae bacterium]